MMILWLIELPERNTGVPRALDLLICALDLVHNTQMYGKTIIKLFDVWDQTDLFF